MRAPAAEDFEAWVEFVSDEETMRFLGGAQARSVAWRGLCTVVGSWTIRGFGMFSVIEKSTSRWVGRLGPWQPEDWPGTEVGWGLARESWGRGYATEGATACMDYVFDVLGWTEAIHTIEPGNAASQAVAKRLSSTLWGPAKMPAPYEETIVETWGQTREQWLARRKG